MGNAGFYVSTFMDGLAVGAIFFSLDQAGSISTFSSFIKVTSIFRFINVFFGDHLELFMSEFGNSVDSSKIEDFEAYLKNRNGTKGKFDKYWRAVTTSSPYLVNTIIYLTSWFFKIIAQILTRRAKNKKEIGTFAFYFIYYQHKIHFGVLNAFISRGILLTTRTIIHTILVPENTHILIDKIFAILCFILVILDFYGLFATVLDFKDEPPKTEQEE